MTNVKEMIEYAYNKADELTQKMIQLKIMLDAAKGSDRWVQPWKSVEINYAAANVEYQALLSDAEAILAEFPKSPADVPVPEDP